MILFRIVEVLALHKLEWYKPKLHKSQDCILQYLKLLSSTSSVKGAFFSIKIRLVGYSL